MRRRLHTLAPFFIAAACIAGSAAAQGQPPPRGIVKVAGELYRAQNDNHFTVFLVTPAGIIMADPRRKSRAGRSVMSIPRRPPIRIGTR